MTCTLPRLLVTEHLDVGIRGSAPTGPLPIRVSVDSSTPDLRAANDAVTFGSR